uniref:Uncharacterized protein n=1 Tax=Ditylenchus dipsaci TaxID=166011 RepID=A0A915CTM5_9BILA
MHAVTKKNADSTHSEESLAEEDITEIGPSTAFDDTIDQQLNTQLPKQQMELTQEELDHIERIRTVEVEVDNSMPLSIAEEQLEAQRNALYDSPVINQFTQQIGLNQEDLDNVKSGKKLVEDNIFEQVKLEQPILPSKTEVSDEEHSSRTSSADSISNEEEVDERSQQTIKNADFTEEELAHIEKIRRLAQESSFDDAFALPSTTATAEVSQTKLPNINESEGILNEIESQTRVQQSIEQTVLTQPVVEHIDSIPSLTEASSPEQAESEQPMLLSELKVEGEKPFSKLSSVDSVNEQEPSPEQYNTEMEKNTKPPAIHSQPVTQILQQHELTQEELEHIDRIRRMAEKSSFEQTKYVSPEPVDVHVQLSQLPVSSSVADTITSTNFVQQPEILEKEDNSSKTSSADSTSAHTASFDYESDTFKLPDANISLLGQESQSIKSVEGLKAAGEHPFEVEQDLTSYDAQQSEIKIQSQEQYNAGDSFEHKEEELAHIDKIRRLAEESSFEQVTFEVSTKAVLELVSREEHFLPETVSKNLCKPPARPPPPTKHFSTTSEVEKKVQIITGRPMENINQMVGQSFEKETRNLETIDQPEEFEEAISESEVISCSSTTSSADSPATPTSVILTLEEICPAGLQTPLNESSQAELDQMEWLRMLAEESSVETHYPVDMEAMAEEVGQNVQNPAINNKPARPPPPSRQPTTITEHPTEEEEYFSDDYSEVDYLDNPSEYDFEEGQPVRAKPSVTRVQLSQTEMEHIQRLIELAEEDGQEQQMNYADESSIPDADLDNVEAKNLESADLPGQSVWQSSLNEEEREHIEWVKQFASTGEKKVVKPHKISESMVVSEKVAPKPYEAEVLSREELDHIQRIRQLAEQESYYSVQGGREQSFTKSTPHQ